MLDPTSLIVLGLGYLLYRSTRETKAAPGTPAPTPAAAPWPEAKKTEELTPKQSADIMSDVIARTMKGGEMPVMQKGTRGVHEMAERMIEEAKKGKWVPISKASEIHPEEIARAKELSRSSEWAPGMTWQGLFPNRQFRARFHGKKRGVEVWKFV